MRTPTALVVLALAATLTACATPAEVIIPEPESTLTPIFESDEEALAAAEDAYAAYLAESDKVFSRGEDSARLLSMVSEDLKILTTSDLELFKESDWHIQGATHFDNVELQQHFEDSTGKAVVIVYLCTDVQDAQIVLSSGEVVTPSGRDERMPFEVEFTFAAANEFQIERVEPWSGEDFCF